MPRMILTSPDEHNHRLGLKLAVLALAMFGFGYMLVPLYQGYCKATGMNGTSRRIDYGQAVTRKPDTSRWVTVEFVANTEGSLPWEFRPEVVSMKIHPGDLVMTRFHARNVGNDPMNGQAVANVTPGQAAPYFHEVAGFCSSSQPLASGESKLLPVQFLVDPDLPSSVATVTLAYTFFAAPAAVQADEPGTAPAPTRVARH